ncbi:MAG: hypothetical protein KJO07_10335 [Deltaproteobacteria bacterium]|nr:hypothetical protein [Deltaproteobacteria bacterium]
MTESQRPMQAQRRRALAAVLLAGLLGCGDPGEGGGAGLPGPGPDGEVDAGDSADGGSPSDGGSAADGGGALDSGITDGGGPSDGGVGPDPDAAPVGIIDGGPCSSGLPGATAYRVRWAGNGSGSTAYPVYEVNGLPDKSRDKIGAYGYQIGFTPSFVDPFLGQGGLQLNSSSFVDIELSTAGVTQVHTATLSIYGRSYNTTTSGSFNWQTFEGVGAAPTNLVSNVAPYQWYSADMTAELSPGDDGVLLRIKAGPSSGSLVVNRIELCLDAD